MATITKRGPYQWQAKIRIKGQKTTSKTFTNRSNAEKWARQIESEMDRGIYISRKEAESTTFSDAINRFIKDHIQKNLSHPQQEINRIKAIQKRDWGKRYIATLRGRDIADFVKEREMEGVSGNTIRLDLALISKLFKVASSDWGMESLRNPVELASKPKISPGRTRRLEGDEEQRLLEASSVKLRPIVQFAIETAMRRSEIASLTWENVNIQNRRFVHLPKTKNGDARSVPLSPEAIRIIKSIPNQKSGSVFGMIPGSITRAMTRACKKAKITGLTFHDLRHEATSRLFENTDLDIMEIKTITGHKSLNMLARYSHLRMHHLADRLAGAKRG